MRERVLLFTKVGSDLGEPGKKGLSAKWIAQAAEDSLARLGTDRIDVRSEEHTSELQSLMRISYAVFCLKKKKQNTKRHMSNDTIVTGTMTTQMNEYKM